MADVTNQIDKPFFLLAFANEQGGGSRYLRLLPEELRRLDRILEEIRSKGLGDYKILPNATLDEILYWLEKRRNQIAVFHYAGHANSFQLLLESDSRRTQPAYASGLAELLGMHRDLKLAFLNGCSTQLQAEQLLVEGVPSVIATSGAIRDRVATNFAASFYGALAAGETLQSAFRIAVAAGRTALGENPQSPGYWAESAEPQDRFPWELYPRDLSPAVASWNLPNAARNPLAALPPLARDIEPPPEPYLRLKPFGREHARVFFGRGYEIRELYSFLVGEGTAPIVLYCGQTGVGKSSLLSAGLLPRLEGIYSIVETRPVDHSLVRSLRAALGGEADSSLRELWLHKEESTGRPLLVLIDQAEEVYIGQASEEADNDVIAFIEALHSIFGRGVEKPKGKLILAFRDEWLARFESRLEQARSRYERLILERLGSLGVEEAVKGPESISEYRLVIDEELPSAISAGLRDDRESPIAPTLSILLSKLWTSAQERAKKEPRGQRKLSVDLYRQLRGEGILLQDFVEQQLDAMASTEPEHWKSGLVLDVLSFFISSLSTGRSRTDTELESSYSGRVEEIRRLVTRSQELGLLAPFRDRKAGDSGRVSSRLAHDTLAPILRKTIDESDRPGQRARRVLRNRLVDWKGGRAGPPLDDADLDAVERGLSGMRDLTVDEHRLLEASRSRWETERAARRCREIAAQAQEYCSLGRPYRGLLLASESFRMSQDRALRVANAEQSLREAIRLVGGLGLCTGEPGGVSDVVFDPKGRWLATAEGYQACLWPLDRQEMLPGPDVLSTEEVICSLAVDPSGDWLALGFWNGQTELWPTEQSRPWFKEKGWVLPGEADDRIDCVAFDSRGTWLATRTFGGVAELWGLQKEGPPAQRWRSDSSDGSITSIAFDSESRWLAAGCDDGHIFLVPLGTTDPRKKALKFFGHEGCVTSLAFDVQGRWLASGSYGEAKLWMLRTDDGPEATWVLDHKSSVSKVGFDREGRWFLTTDGFKTVRLWSMNTLDAYPVVLRHDAQVRGMAFDPNGLSLATATMDGTVRLWPLDSDDPYLEVTSIHCHDGDVSCLEFDSDGKWLAIGSSEEGMTRLWPLETPDPSREPVVLTHQCGVTCLSFDTTGHRLATGGDGVRLWKIGDFSLSDDGEALGAGRSDVCCLTIDARGDWLAAGRFDGMVELWSLDPALKRRVSIDLPGHDREITCIGFDANSCKLAAGSSDRNARIWALDSAGALGEPSILTGHHNGITCLAFDCEGRRIVTGGWDHEARLWTIADDNSFRESVLLKAHDSFVTCAVFGLNDAWIATGGGDGTIRLWTLGADGSAPDSSTLWDAGNCVECLSIAPGGQWMAAGLGDGATLLWKINELVPALKPAVLRGHEGSVASIAFAPDGRWLASGSTNGDVYLWSLVEPISKDPVVLRGHGEEVTCVDFDTRGRWLATGSIDGTARIWSLAPKDLLYRAQRILGRNASRDEWDLFFPGEPYRKTFPDLPFGVGAEENEGVPSPGEGSSL